MARAKGIVLVSSVLATACVEDVDPRAPDDIRAAHAALDVSGPAMSPDPVLPATYDVVAITGDELEVRHAAEESSRRSLARRTWIGLVRERADLLVIGRPPTPCRSAAPSPESC